MSEYTDYIFTDDAEEARKYIYYISADDAEGINVEFRRAEPIKRRSTWEAPFTDEMVNHGFDGREAKQVFEELGQSGHWLNVTVERYEINRLYELGAVDSRTTAEATGDRRNEYSFQKTAVAGIEVDMTAYKKGGF